MSETLPAVVEKPGPVKRLLTAFAAKFLPKEENYELERANIKDHATQQLDVYREEVMPEAIQLYLEVLKREHYERCNELIGFNFRLLREVICLLNGEGLSDVALEIRRKLDEGGMLCPDPKGEKTDDVSLGINQKKKLVTAIRQLSRFINTQKGIKSKREESVKKMQELEEKTGRFTEVVKDGADSNVLTHPQNIISEDLAVLEEIAGDIEGEVEALRNFGKKPELLDVESESIRLAKPTVEVSEEDEIGDLVDKLYEMLLELDPLPILPHTDGEFRIVVIDRYDPSIGGALMKEHYLRHYRDIKYEPNHRLLSVFPFELDKQDENIRNKILIFDPATGNISTRYLATYQEGFSHGKDAHDLSWDFDLHDGDTDSAWPREGMGAPIKLENDRCERMDPGIFIDEYCSEIPEWKQQAIEALRAKINPRLIDDKLHPTATYEYFVDDILKKLNAYALRQEASWALLNERAKAKKAVGYIENVTMEYRKYLQRRIHREIASIIRKISPDFGRTDKDDNTQITDHVPKRLNIGSLKPLSELRRKWYSS